MPTQPSQMPEPRIISGINYVGLYTLIKREVGRFTSVYMQTIFAPMVTTLLFYAVFALAFGGITRKIGEVAFLDFLAPGLIMMAMVQNAFANTSSSVMIAKLQGNIVDIIMPPLSNAELVTGFLVGGVLRGLAVGITTGLAVSVFVPISIHAWWAVLVFGFLGNLLLSSLGLIGGIWADKFDHLAAVTNFVITPLTFLSGTFYAVDSLPPAWQAIAHYNPFFYMIDGFRYGFIGQADGALGLGIALLVVMNLVVIGLTVWMLRIGYKIKS